MDLAYGGVLYSALHNSESSLRAAISDMHVIVMHMQPLDHVLWL